MILSIHCRFIVQMISKLAKQIAYETVGIRLILL